MSILPKHYKKFLQLGVRGLPPLPAHKPMLSSVYFRSSHKNTEILSKKLSIWIIFDQHSINNSNDTASFNIVINTRLTLDWHLINILMNTQLIYNQQLVDSRPIVD